MGSYFLQLRGKVDAVVFSAGMGENSAFLRGRIMESLDVGCQSPRMQSCLYSHIYIQACARACTLPSRETGRCDADWEVAFTVPSSQHVNVLCRYLTCT